MSSAEGDTTTPAPHGEVDTPPHPSPAGAVLDALTTELGDVVIGSEIRGEDLWVRVKHEAWRRTAETCHALGFDYFCFLSGIDWMPHTWPNPGQPAEASGADPEHQVDPDAEEGEPGADVAYEGSDTPGARRGWETGFAGGDTRFQVLARLHSIDRKLGVILKADLDDDEPRVDSWTPVYPGADWHERETWEMYGFDFVGHPHLTHLYLPSEFEGFPLRKDFPLLAREVKPWPGLVDPEPMPGEGESESGNGQGGGEDQS
ncbi:MAG: NADH-quinone oxidoreductase subunit C [Actinomycetota bacterium]|nr:NADH-quinone oxidoreductase subunit C [Actinomycetota bacterium]